MVTKTPRSRTGIFPSIALAAAALAAAGCGGGGDSGVAPNDTSLSFTVNWEQRLSGAQLASGPGTAAFDTPIPPSVNAIRFIMRPASPASPCCIAVVRGSQAFIDRRIVLADVQPGLGTLEVNGYPTDFAPSDGVPATCPTRPGGQGSSCSSQDTLPSFGSDEISVDVLPGETNVVDVDVHSLPFLLNLDPEDGGTVDSNPPNVNFTVVDANHDIDTESLDIRIQADGNVNTDILDLEECLDGDAELPDCSEGGELEVRGVHVTSISPVVLPPGEADLRIRATNTAPTPRDMESNTTFLVPGQETTTTTNTTTTTESSTTTSTTFETTTTTLVLPQTFCLDFSVSTTVDFIGISYNVFYTATGGDFTGSGDQVSCFSLLEGNPESTLVTFNDNDGTSTLSTAIISAETLSGPIDLAQCEFTQVPPLSLGNFSIQVTEVTAPDLSPTSATVVVTETPCPF